LDQPICSISLNLKKKKKKKKKKEPSHKHPDSKIKTFPKSLSTSLYGFQISQDSESELKNKEINHLGRNPFDPFG
jgi:hypothetical protein